VVPYELSDIVTTLSGIAREDWTGFFARRVSVPMDELPTDWVPLTGYRIGYAAKPSGYLDYLQAGRRGAGFVCARDSLGLTFSPEGRVTNVVPRKPGDAAGLATGMQVAAVNGRRFSRERLNDALVESRKSGKVELMLTEGDRFRTVAADYGGGPRFLTLERDEARPDVLADILRPRTNP
jgi:predicted metalloprotease with PDZ domain